MKELFLLRGLPGSGKTTLANSIGGFNVEADNYFLTINEEYEFDSTQLKHAHQWCQSECEEAMQHKFKIVVSNTFTMEWEMQPYFDLAEKYGYRVYSLVVENRHGESENTNIHNVPKEKIDKMRKRFEINL